MTRGPVGTFVTFSRFVTFRPRRFAHVRHVIARALFPLGTYFYAPPSWPVVRVVMKRGGSTISSHEG